MSLIASWLLRECHRIPLLGKHCTNLSKFTFFQWSLTENRISYPSTAITTLALLTWTTGCKSLPYTEWFLPRMIQRQEGSQDGNTQSSLTYRSHSRETPKFTAPLPVSPFTPPDRDRRVDSHVLSARGSRRSPRTSGWGRSHEEIRKVASWLVPYAERSRIPGAL